MSADDMTFLDTLSSVPNDIKKYSSDVADYVDKHLQHASNTLRDTLSSSPWIPESARPRPPPAPPRRLVESVASASMYARVQDWVVNHKLLTTIIVGSLGGLTYHIVKRKSNRKKRRARKAGNGARLEVVVVAGSPSEPLVRSISLDLERRGFIVYVLCNTIEDEILVQNESRQDIRPLMLDILDPESASASIERFTEHLRAAHAPFAGAKPNHLTLRSLIIIPSLQYPVSPIATLSPSALYDLINTRLLTPIITTQAFLPLLTSPPIHAHHSIKQVQPKPMVLVLTPSIIPSLSPAFHAPESLLIAALTSFTSVLKSELSPLSIPVAHLQLGTFDLSAFSSHNFHQKQTQQSQRAETLKWDDQTRASYAKNYVALSTNLGKGKGSPLRELNNAVFDAMASGTGGIIRVGMGAGVYGFVGRWVPASMIGWMMGMRGVGPQDGMPKIFKGLIENGGSSGAASSVGNISDIGDLGGERLGESDYIYPEGADGAEWRENK